ncbi:hypothetical protein CCMA1212_001106 [Trichoderma ghanense]|uniref:Uncharacterized protein n=1 Tax=Trichoderma ghanense TaxID=65468 RepID=A0ABY2HFE0_9HYPO
MRRHDARTTVEQQGNTDNETAAQDDCPHVEVTMTGDEQGASKAKTAFPSADIASEQCSCDDGPQSSKMNEYDSNNGFIGGARRPLELALWLLLLQSLSPHPSWVSLERQALRQPE